MTKGETLRADLRARLRLPAIVAPMFLVSGPDLVIASCRGGAVGSFPTLNARTPEQLDEWLTHIGEATRDCRAPYAANLILHKSNERRDGDLDLIVRHEVPMVIASVGSPAAVVEPLQAYGGLVFSDVASVRHARKAAEAGADGLVLLTAGAGGNTGWLNPFAFVAAVREFFDGPLVVAGCLTRGAELRALELIGADLGYFGTAFLASAESMAPEAHKNAVAAAGADDILQTDALSGMPANFIRARLEEAGVLRPDGSIDRGAGSDVASWKHVWSAGQGVGHVRGVEPVAAILDRLAAEYEETR